MIQHSIFTTLLALLFSLALPAQNATDALRFSYFDYGGTGRFVGVNGALGAFGTEFSTLSTNPAGLAMYRSSEVIVSPAVLITRTNSQLEGAFLPFEESFLPQADPSQTLSESRTVFNLNNLGLVVQSNPRNPKFTTMNFGIGFNHIGNFNQHFFYEGRSVGSIVDRWQEFANTFGVDPNNASFEENVAFNAGALLYDEQADFYVTDYDLTHDQDGIGAPILRNQRAQAEGSMSEMVLSLATNYDELLMFGLTVGVPIVNYRISKTYREEDDQELVPFFDDLVFEESLSTTGAGVNFKFGMIIRPTQAIRIGGAVHSPTGLNLNDESDFAIGYTFTDDQGTSSGFAESDILPFEYRIRTPWRYFANAGFLIQRYGFLTVDLEWVDYSSAEFRYNGFQNEEEFANQDINNSLQSVMNVRIGGEFAYKLFRIRGGIGLLPSPYAGDTEQNLSYSAGLGYRGEKFFADLAWRNRRESVGFVPYDTFDAPQQFVNNDISYHSIVLSLGMRY